MKGHWQKNRPPNNGEYWTAGRDGALHRITVVCYTPYGVYENGHLTTANTCWKGWWWSEPVELPPEPPEWNNPEETP